MRTQALQQRSVTFAGPTPADEASQQVLKIDLGGSRCKRLPAWFFAGPRVVNLWPPDVRPVWARAKSVTMAAPPPVSGNDMVIDTLAWTQAMQQNTRVWVRQFGTTLGQVNYFEQLQGRVVQRLPPEMRAALEALLPTPDGSLIFNVLPQLALRSMGHTPLPGDPGAADALLQGASALLVWPALLVAPSCCDAVLATAVQQALSPDAVRRLSDFSMSPLGAAFLGLIREMSRDPMVQTADTTVRNNLQAGLRDELLAMHRESAIARMRELGNQLKRDVGVLRGMLADKQDVLLHATGHLDRTLISLQSVAALAEELRRGPGPMDGGDLVWEVALLERVQQAVPRLQADVGGLLGAVGLGAAAAPALAQLFSFRLP